MSTLTGVTGSIGGTELFAGGCFTGTAAVSGAAVGMVVTVTPRVYPGSGITWQGFVSAPNVVTVKVCSTIAAFVDASVYDVQVNDGASSGGGPTVQDIVTGSRVLGTVYQNTNPTPMYVLVTADGNNTPLLAFTDAANPPTTIVGYSLTADALESINVFFIVLPGNFYMMATPGPPVDVWTEWH